MSRGFDSAAFYADLDRARAAHGVQWKTIARATGVSQSTLSRIKQGRGPDAASMAALCAWAGIDHRKYVITEPARPKLDTNTLMSSLREMVTADIQGHLCRQAGDAAGAETAGAHYSRHEAVVREQLAELGRVASAYKEPVRYR